MVFSVVVQSRYHIEKEIAKCKPGTRWKYVSGGCTECPAGKSQPFAGQSGCYACKKGMVSKKGADGCIKGTAGMTVYDQEGQELLLSAAPDKDTDAANRIK